MAVGFIFVFLLAIVVPTTYAVEHVVGGSAGWSPAIDYVRWAAGETFQIGDTLRFNYDVTHNVNQVTPENYNTCTAANPIAAHASGSTTITLKECGPMYFICGTPGHCAGGGMKLSIFVGAAGGVTTPSPTNMTTPTNTVPPPPIADMIYAPPTPDEILHCGGSSFVGVNYLIIGVSMVLATFLGFMVL